jgi:polyhydroxybutyrate depolymerase
MKNLITVILTFAGILLYSGCKSDPPPSKVYRIAGKMTVDGRTRTFLINLPPGYYESQNPLPVVIGLHGTGGSAEQFERDYAFSKKSNSSGFIAVYPEGVRGDGVLKLRTWNAGACCDYAVEHKIDDVKYIRNLIDQLVATYHADPRRIYVTGMSNGGMLTYRLASEMPDKIAAIAPVSSTMMISQAINKARAMPILHIHSSKDTKVPYSGGKGLGGYYFPSVDSTLHVWTASNSCRTGPVELVNDPRFKLTEWSDCDQNVIIRRYLTEDGGHSWPGGSKGNARGDEPSAAINATDVIWDFFKSRSLP